MAFTAASADERCDAGDGDPVADTGRNRLAQPNEQATAEEIPLRPRSDCGSETEANGAEVDEHGAAGHSGRIADEVVAERLAVGERLPELPVWEASHLGESEGRATDRFAEACLCPLDRRAPQRFVEVADDEVVELDHGDEPDHRSDCQPDRGDAGRSLHVTERIQGVLADAGHHRRGKPEPECCERETDRCRVGVGEGGAGVTAVHQAR